MLYSYRHRLRVPRRVALKMNTNEARGYIASGEFRGNRVAQHIQNQIVKLYCDSNNLVYILSRAEYWMNKNSQCQLWAALQEGYKHIIFYSLWQLPDARESRRKIFKYCIENKIHLHFAVERLNAYKFSNSFLEIELLIQINTSAIDRMDKTYLSDLNSIINN